MKEGGEEGGREGKGRKEGGKGRKEGEKGEPRRHLLIHTYTPTRTFTLLHYLTHTRTHTHVRRNPDTGYDVTGCITPQGATDPDLRHHKDPAHSSRLLKAAWY